MANLTEGYVSGLDYTYGYHVELNPLRIPLHFLNAGLAAPAIKTACELGFGHGVSINVHAAGSTAEWYGTDFNSAQAAFAQELAAASGAAAKLYDESFADFCAREDLPDFDFVGLHGVWSWISDRNRSIIADFLRRKLKVGGVLYISYNTPAGDAVLTPMQEILTRHADLMGSPGQSTASRIDHALDFADTLIGLCPKYAEANPQIAKRLTSMRQEDRSYVAHEYFNRDWQPTSFARMAEWLAPAKLEFACSANFFNTVDAWNLTQEQQTLLTGIPDATLRETVRDIMVNQRFRKDYWVRGARKLTVAEKVEGLWKQRIVLLKPRAGVSVKVVGERGTFTPQKSVSDPILDALADHRPRTFAQVELAIKDKGVGLSPLFVEVILSLIEAGDVFPVQDDAVIRSARKQTDRLNAFLTERSRHHSNVTALVSPVIGTALTETNRILMFFCLALRQGRKQPADLIAFVSRMLGTEGMTLLESEKPYLAADEKDQAVARTAAAQFGEHVMPILRALQVL